LQETATLLGLHFDKHLGHEALYDATLCGLVYFGLKNILDAGAVPSPDLQLTGETNVNSSI